MGIDNTADIHERIAAADAALRAVGQQLHPALSHIDVAVRCALAARLLLTG